MRARAGVTRQAVPAALAPTPPLGGVCEPPPTPPRSFQIPQSKAARNCVSLPPARKLGTLGGSKEAGDSLWPPEAPPGRRSLRSPPPQPLCPHPGFFFFLPNLQTGNSLSHNNTRERRPRPLAPAHSPGRLQYSGSARRRRRRVGSAGDIGPAAGVVSEAPKRRPEPPSP